MKDLTPEEAGRWISAAPPLVQETVTSQATQQTIEQIGKQYVLHVDVIELLMKLTNYMLLGYTGPEEFLKELRAMTIPDQQARQIIGDINQKIFVPLREQMRSGAGNMQQQRPQSAAPSAAPRPVQASVPSYTYAQPKQSSPQPVTKPPRPSPEATAGAAQPVIQPAQPPRPLQQQIAQAPQPSPMATAGTASVPQMQPPRPVNIGRLLEDHEEPHIDIRDKVQGVSLPGSQPPVSVQLKPYPLPLTPKPSASPLIKSYGVDPYHEPIDEK